MVLEGGGFGQGTDVRACVRAKNRGAVLPETGFAKAFKKELERERQERSSSRLCLKCGSRTEVQRSEQVEAAS